MSASIVIRMMDAAADLCADVNLEARVNIQEGYTVLTVVEAAVVIMTEAEDTVITAEEAMAVPAEKAGVIGFEVVRTYF
jgi:hypothetical protein